MINQLLHNIYLASLCSTIFAVIFVFLKNIFTKYIGARWYYYLWFIIFIPWLAIWLPLNFFPDINTTFNFHILTTPLSTHQQLQNVSIESRVSLSKMIFIVWLLGASLYSIFILFRHFQFISFLKENSSSLTDEQQQKIKNILPNKYLISLKRIYLSTAITSPMICHIIESKIYLPGNFFRDYIPTEQKYVLQHECVHYQRCDLIANTGMLILICFNWFNPIILFSYRYFRSAQELSCDAIISYQFSSTEKKAYGHALLKSSLNECSEASALSCWWNTGSQLKERCSMLKFHHSKPMKNFMGLIILAATASIAIAAPNLDKRNIESDMKISNSSKNPLTFSINNICSEDIRVVEGHSVKVVSQKRINKACQENPSHCEAQVYSSDNCTGKIIVSLILDMSAGVVSILPRSDDYHVGSNGFNLFFDGPWI